MLKYRLEKFLAAVGEAEPQLTPQGRRFDNFFLQIIKYIRSRIWLSIAVGGLLAGLGLLLRFAILGPTITRVFYVTFFPTIAIAALVGGVAGALTATLFIISVVHWIFVPLAHPGDWIYLLFFLFSDVLIISIVEMFFFAQTRAARADAAKRALERSAARDELLSKFATRLLQSADPQSVIRDVCREVMDFLNCDVCLNFLFDQRSGRIYLNACAGVSEEQASKVQRLDCEGESCVRSAKEAARDDAAQHAANCCSQKELLYSLGVRCYSCRPLFDEQGRVIGSLTFGDRARSSFDSATLETMEAVGHLISLALSRTRMETALRESEERFSRFMRHLIGYAWIKDDEGRYVFANESFTRITDGPPHLLIGKTDRELFGAETAAKFREHDRIALENPIGLTTIEHLVDRGGTRRHYLVSKFPIPSSYGEKAFVGGVAIDDTQRAQAEEKLQEATARLRDADRRKDQFLATLAHELRNPLAPISSGLAVLRRIGNHDPAVDKIQSIMERQIEHLVRLVDDLLEVSRISHGTIALKKEPLDLASVIESAVEANRQLIDAANLELRIDLPEQALRLEADPVRLNQVVANLLNNAAKYTDAGGRINIRAERQGEMAVVTVADTGVGIPANMLPRVFDLFAQVNCTRGRAQGGLGIGLALVRDLVELHGGSVEAKSAGEGKGSRFLVRLPLGAVAANKSHAQDHAAIRPSTRARRVLIVDDTRDVADSLALQMSVLGAEVRVAYSGAEGLNSFEEFNPEVVFLDIGMPGMDGCETARRMRERPQGRTVALIAITGWGEDETRKRVEAAGFDRHLTKPAQTADLLQALEFADHESPARADSGQAAQLQI